MSKSRECFDVVHILASNSLISYQYIRFLKENSDISRHIFIMLGEKPVDPAASKDEQLVHLQSFKRAGRNIKSILQSSEKIVVHGFFSPWLMLFLVRRKSFARKTYIVFWGGDLYPHISTNTSIKQTLLLRLKKMVIKNSAGVANLIEADYRLVKDLFGEQRCHLLVDYPFDYDAIDPNKNYLKATDPPVILLGNSATPTNMHAEIIDKLARYSESDFLVICPLSYGDPEYRDEIVRYGEMKLGQRFFPLVELEDEALYRERLSKVSVGIFNNNRQQGMGNIVLLLGMGAKVYLRKDTGMWAHFSENVHAKVFDIEEIGSKSFDDIFTMSPETAESNKKSVAARLSYSLAAKKWETLFRI